MTFYRSLPKCFFLIPIFFSTCIFAQTKFIDSAKKEIAVLKNNQQKLAAVFLLCDQYRALNPDTLNTYIKLAEELSAKNNNAADKIKTSFYKCIFLINKAELDSAGKLIERTLS